MLAFEASGGGGSGTPLPALEAEARENMYATSQVDETDDHDDDDVLHYYMIDCCCRAGC